MKIGITIDGVLRDFLGQVESVHQKYFPSDNEEEKIKVLDYDLEKWVTFPDEEVLQGELLFNPEFNEETFLESEENTDLVKSTNKVTLEEFLHERCTLELFGYAEESVSSAMETLNQLILDNPKHEFYLLTREGGLAIPSTHFFLAKTKSICPNVKFITEYDKFWEDMDVIVSDNPKVLSLKPNNKLSVIIDKDYNKEIKQSGLRIKTIKELDTLVLDSLESALNSGVFEWVL
jgi:hypothetical protein